jgi:hypothetical protein
LFHNPLDITTYSIELQEVADPAAGTELSIVPPAGRILALACLDFQFTSDANVAGRTVYIDYRWALRHYRLGSSYIAVPANTTWHFICHPNQVLTTAGAVQDIAIAIPDLQLINDNAEIYVKVTNIQATDQISDIHAIWKSWWKRPS